MRLACPWPFRPGPAPVARARAHAAHVVYAGTASKSLAPGLRLGWLVLPADLAGEVTAAIEAGGWLPSVLDQLTLAEFIASGGYDRQIRHARLSYRRRRDALVAALRQQAPGVAVTGIAAGLHALVTLPGGQAEDDVTSRATQHGLALNGLAVFAAPAATASGTSGAPGETPRGERAAGGGAAPEQALVVGYARPAGHAFSTAVARLCAVLASF